MLFHIDLQKHTLLWPESYLNALKQTLVFVFFGQAEDEVSITTPKVTSEKREKTQSITIPQA